MPGASVDAAATARAFGGDASTSVALTVSLGKPIVGRRVVALDIAQLLHRFRTMVRL
jgi:hypothetical protein